jgi:chemotaxis protein MotA
VDKSTVFGLLLAIGGILTGLLMEGGQVSQILQPTAAIIVFAGTVGAVMVQFPMALVIAAVKNLRYVLFEPDRKPHEKIAELVKFANKARRDGIVSIDAELNSVSDNFMKRCLMLAVDGSEPQELRKVIEVELESSAEYEEEIPRVYESAGGFAPTIGIIGAVLGLIQVMQHLDNISEVGRGIAVAFVATVYGVGSANIFFLPAAGKLKARFRDQQILRAMTLEGVISILEGMNPRMLENKLNGFLLTAQEETKKELKKRPVLEPAQ